MLMSICQSRVTIKRQTSELFDSQVAASSITVSRNPNTTATVQVKKEGTATAGTFTITGTIVEYDANNTPSSTAVSETLSLSAYQKLAVTLKQYDTVTTVDCSADLVTAGVTVICNYFGNDGGSIESQTSIVTDFPAQFVRKDSSFPVERFGSFSKEKPDLLIPYDTSFTPEIADVVINDFTSEKFLIEGTPLIQQIGIGQYWRISLAKDKNL